MCHVMFLARQSFKFFPFILSLPRAHPRFLDLPWIWLHNYKGHESVYASISSEPKWLPVKYRNAVSPFVSTFVSPFVCLPLCLPLCLYSVQFCSTIPKFSVLNTRMIATSIQRSIQTGCKFERIDKTRSVENMHHLQSCLALSPDNLYPLIPSYRGITRACQPWLSMALIAHETHSTMRSSEMSNFAHCLTSTSFEQKAVTA